MPPRCKKGARHEIGTSRGGKNTKIHAVVDALGNPIYLQLSEGNIHDSKVATDVLSHVTIAGSVIQGDRAYGSLEIRAYIESMGATYNIPPKSNSVNPWNVDWWLYKECHLVECFFGKLKHFRRVATRYDKLASSFFAFALLAAISILVK